MDWVPCRAAELAWWIVGIQWYRFASDLGADWSVDDVSMRGAGPRIRHGCSGVGVGGSDRGR